MDLIQYIRVGFKETDHFLVPGGKKDKSIQIQKMVNLDFEKRCLERYE